MNSETLELVKQIDVVINMLEIRLNAGCEKKILQTIYYRYKLAKEILINCENFNKIRIKGGCKAYLDAYNDYSNPILDEMFKAEKLLESIKY